MPCAAPGIRQHYTCERAGRHTLRQHLEERKLPPAEQLSYPALRALHTFDVRRLQTLGAFFNFKAHPGALFESTISIALDRREVYEHVLAAFALDESVTFGGVEPLYRSLFLHTQST